MTAEPVEVPGRLHPPLAPWQAPLPFTSRLPQPAWFWVQVWVQVWVSPRLLKWQPLGWSMTLIS